MISLRRNFRVMKKKDPVLLMRFQMLVSERQLSLLLWSTLDRFFPVLAVVLVLRSFLYEPFQIPSSSMMPTLEVGDYILVNKFSYGLRLPVTRTKIFDVGGPERGDVMVFFHRIKMTLTTSNVSLACPVIA